MAIGGSAGRRHIWYEFLIASDKKTQFADLPTCTYLKALLNGSTEQCIVLEAWKTVGVPVAAALVAGCDRVVNGSGARPAREVRGAPKLP